MRQAFMFGDTISQTIRPESYEGEWKTISKQLSDITKK